MSSDVKIPEWATEEAGKIADVWQHPMHHDHQILSQDIARALLAAEQRGFERAADRAFEIMEGRLRQKAAYEVVGQKREARDFETMAIEGNYIAAAIRSLGEKT